jgi:hypothetical protein
MAVSPSFFMGILIATVDPAEETGILVFCFGA